VELPEHPTTALPAVTAASSDAYELDLLQRTADRDRSAFEALYATYYRRLDRFLTRMTRRRDVAEEIINDTMWVVWQRAGDFRGASRVSTWVMGIAYRRALKSFRRAGMQVVSVGLEHAEDAPSPNSADVDDFERNDLVTQGLAELPFEQRLVIELTYYLGHSCSEIAEILDCPVNTVKTRMFHARRKLRTRLPELSGGSIP
jgi:RNA polymerase sigma-70 factor (ECF subfamily)